MRDIAVDIFQAERELVGIHALGATSKLHSLQPFDDRTLQKRTADFGGRAA